MIQKVLLVLSFLMIGGYTGFAQVHITGKVTGTDSPEGIPGVNVLIKGTTNGTISAIDGSYSMDVPGDTSVIVFSFVGYTNEEVVVGNQKIINVVLIPALEELGEVIVTALGITRDEKALGYSIQKVDGDQIAKVKELDVINALSGKVSGVNIIQADGSLGGGGSRIVIRGESSLAGNNDPLYIINGIEGNANDVAPDDIESISVLKGAAAAALYGSKAGAGVVMITSKRGKIKEGTLVEFSSNTTFQTPLVLPKYQNKYGQGKGGAYNYINGTDGNDPNYDDAQNNWGPEFDGQLRSQFTGNKPWVAYKNNVKDFYQVGHIFINSVAVSKSTENFSSRFSYSNTDQKGILPNTGLATNRLALNSDFKINDKLKLSANLAYINTDCKNNASFDVRFIPRSIDIAALKNYWVPGMEGKQQMNWRRSDNNPYFWMYENINSYKDTKFIFNVDLTYTILPNLTVVGRYGSNYINNEYYDRRAPSTYNRDNKKDAEGWHKKGLANTKDRTAEFLISYDRDLFNDFNAKVSFGGTHYHNEYSKLEANGYGMKFFDLHDLNNSTYHIVVDDWFESLERNSLYGFINLAYQSKIYLDLTYRNDWSSTLHPDNNSYPYPSATLSAIMSDIFELPTVFSFWKLRGSWAQVGKDIPKPYFIADKKFSWIPNVETGFYYPQEEDVFTDPKLKPEITTGIEIGTEVKVLNNRLGFDLTYYQSSTINQLLKMSVSESTKYKYFMINAGVISSKGVELSLYATPAKTSDLSWDIQLNWSFDRTYIDELTVSSIEKYKVQKVNSFLYIEDHVGQRRGTFYGQAYERAPNGERLYTLSGDTKLTAKQQLGNYNPDWIASLSNNITYKNFSLSFLLDLRYGGLIYNEIERKLNMYGLSEATLLNDREGIVPDGMVEDNGTYRKLTMQDLIDSKIPDGQSGQQYWETQMEEACPENELIDDTYLKLREVSLSYNIPAKWLPGKYVKSATIAFVGRNLAVWSKVKHIDPETFGNASEKSDYNLDTKVPGYANSSLPSVRNFGFTLNCKF